MTERFSKLEASTASALRLNAEMLAAAQRVHQTPWSLSSLFPEQATGLAALAALGNLRERSSGRDCGLAIQSGLPAGLPSDSSSRDLGEILRMKVRHRSLYPAFG